MKIYYTVVRFTICPLSSYIVDDAIKFNELGGVCDIPEGGDEMYTEFNL
jgi:hypothetical protein